MVSISPKAREKIEQDVIQIIRETAPPYDERLNKIYPHRGPNMPDLNTWASLTSIKNTGVRYVVGKLEDEKKVKEFMEPSIPFYPNELRKTLRAFVEDLFDKLNGYKHSDKVKNLLQGI